MESASVIRRLMSRLLLVFMVLFALSNTWVAAQDKAEKKTWLAKFEYKDGGTIEVYNDSVRLLDGWSKKDRDAAAAKLKEAISSDTDRLEKQGARLPEKLRAVWARGIQIKQKALEHLEAGRIR